MAIGQIGKYERLDILGHGASGIVYLAWDTLLRRKVALKEIRAAGPETDRVLGEARVLDRLRHPNIIAVHSVDSVDGTILIDMELVTGWNLADLLKERKGEPLPLPEAAYVVLGVLEALAYAHGQRVVHRDVKPANILIAEGGGVKLTDFGLAEALGSGSIVGGGGTYPYMAPEDFSENPETDSRADLWAVGVVLYELVTGRRPFAAADSRNPFSWQQAILETTPPPASTLNKALPVALDGVLNRALARDKSARFSRADAFSDAIRALVPNPVPLVVKASAPVAPPSQAESDDPSVFSFSDGREARTLDELLSAAARNWDVSRLALESGRFEAFLRAIGEVFIADLARDLSARRDLSPDRKLREFLERASPDEPEGDRTVARPLPKVLRRASPALDLTPDPPRAEAPKPPVEETPEPPPVDPNAPRLRWWFPLVFLLCLAPPVLAFVRHPGAELMQTGSGLLPAWVISAVLYAMLALVGLGARLPVWARGICLVPLGIGVLAGGALAANRLTLSPTRDSLMPVAAGILLPLGLLLIQAASARIFWRGWLTFLLFLGGLAVFVFSAV